MEFVKDFRQVLFINNLFMIIIKIFEYHLIDLNEVFEYCVFTLYVHQQFLFELFSHYFNQSLIFK